MKKNISYPSVAVRRRKYPGLKLKTCLCSCSKAVCRAINIIPAISAALLIIPANNAAIFKTGIKNGKKLAKITAGKINVGTIRSEYEFFLLPRLLFPKLPRRRPDSMIFCSEVVSIVSGVFICVFGDDVREDGGDEGRSPLRSVTGAQSSIETGDGIHNTGVSTTHKTKATVNRCII